jgi:hypothetical protein
MEHAEQQSMTLDVFRTRMTELKREKVRDPHWAYINPDSLRIEDMLLWERVEHMSIAPNELEDALAEVRGENRNALTDSRTNFYMWLCNLYQGKLVS